MLGCCLTPRASARAQATELTTDLTLPYFLQGWSVGCAHFDVCSLQGIYSSCFVAPQHVQSSWNDIGGLEDVKEQLVWPYHSSLPANLPHCLTYLHILQAGRMTSAYDVQADPNTCSLCMLIRVTVGCARPRVLKRKLMVDAAVRRGRGSSSRSKRRRGRPTTC